MKNAFRTAIVLLTFTSLLVSCQLFETPASDSEFSYAKADIVAGIAIVFPLTGGLTGTAQTDINSEMDLVDTTGSGSLATKRTLSFTSYQGEVFDITGDLVYERSSSSSTSWTVSGILTLKASTAAGLEVTIQKIEFEASTAVLDTTGLPSSASETVLVDSKAFEWSTAMLN